MSLIYSILELTESRDSYNVVAENVCPIELFFTLLRIFSHSLKKQKQPPEMFYKKGVLKNFAKFTGKHLCDSFLFNRVASKSPGVSF